MPRRRAGGGGGGGGGGGSGHMESKDGMMGRMNGKVEDRHRRRRGVAAIYNDDDNDKDDLRGGASPRIFPPPSRDRVLFAILSLATTLAYSPVFRAGFVWDDTIITDCESVRAWSGLYDMWFRPWLLKPEIHYWPMVYTTFWIEYRLWGFNPLGYHVVNLALHIVNSYLVQKILRRIGASEASSWLAAFVFALHPTRVESVAWVIERKDVLSGLFYLLALLYHPSVGWPDESRTTTTTTTTTTKTTKKTKTLREPSHFAMLSNGISTSLLCYALAMLSKTIVVSLPVALLVIPWMVHGTLRPVHAVRSVPFFVVGVIMALFDVSLARAGEPVDFNLTFVQRLFIAARAICFYMWKLARPTDLMIVYPIWSFDHDGKVWNGCFLLIVAASVASLGVVAFTTKTKITTMSSASARIQNDVPGAGAGTGTGTAAGKDCGDRCRRHLPIRIVASAFVLFGATLFPVLCLLDYGYMRFSYVADRFGYLAGIAPISVFAVFVAEGCTWLFPPRATKTTTTTTTNTRMTKANHRSDAIGSFVSRTSPLLLLGSAVLLAVLGSLAYQQSSIFVSEESYYSHIVRLNPLARSMWTNLGNVHMRRGNNELAAEYYETALKNDPSADKLHTNYGIVLSKLGRMEEAVDVLTKSLTDVADQSRTSRKKVLNELGNAMSRLGRYDEAAGYFRQALDIDPTYAIGWNNLGNDLYRAGKSGEAVDAYRNAFRLKPNYHNSRWNCAIVLGTAKRYEEQVELLREIIRIDPDNLDAKDRLDAALVELNK